MITRIAGIFALALAAALALQPAEIGATQEPRYDTGARCNNSYCIPVTGVCWGPGQGHCTSVYLISPVTRNPDGSWTYGKPVLTCHDYPCVGNMPVFDF